jgi:hypothetical protein
MAEPVAGAESHSNTAAVQATNDDASASKLCVIVFELRFTFHPYLTIFPAEVVVLAKLIHFFFSFCLFPDKMKEKWGNCEETKKYDVIGS